MRNIDKQIVDTFYNTKKDFQYNDVREAKNLVEKALAVLQEAGLFSMILLLEYNMGPKGKKSAAFLLKYIKNLIDDNSDVLGISVKNAKSDNELYYLIVEYLEKITSDINKTMFVSNLIYQGFIYLRYHLKSGTVERAHGMG